MIGLTYFPPFDATGTNSSAEAAAALSRIRPHTPGKLIPNSFADVPAAVRQAVTEHDVLLMLGQDASAQGLALEQFSLNWVDTGGRADGRGWSAEGRKIVDDPALVGAFAPFQVRLLVQELRRRDHAAYASFSAGTHLCNFAYFHALALAQVQGACRVLFVHVPASLQQVSMNSDRRQMAVASSVVAAALADLMELMISVESDFALAA